DSYRCGGTCTMAHNWHHSNTSNMEEMENACAFPTKITTPIWVFATVDLESQPQYGEHGAKDEARLKRKKSNCHLQQSSSNSAKKKKKSIFLVYLFIIHIYNFMIALQFCSVSRD